jgi:hypothetical protein
MAKRLLIERASLCSHRLRAVDGPRRGASFSSERAQFRDDGVMLRTGVLLTIAVLVVGVVGCTKTTNITVTGTSPPSVSATPTLPAAPTQSSVPIGSPSVVPTPSSSAPKAAARNTLIGFGAPKATWISTHGPVDRGPFSGVQFEPAGTHNVYTYSQDFRSTSQANALILLAAQFPPDAHIVHAKRVGSACYGVIYRSAALKHNAPSLGRYIQAYLYTGDGDGPYNAERVNNAIISTSGADQFPAC